MDTESRSELPHNIRERLSRIFEEIEDIMISVERIRAVEYKRIQLQYLHSAPGDFLTAEERAQQTSFITRYNQLPEFSGPQIIENNGKYYLKNLDEMRYILNEYRTILFNENDSIYFKNLHTFCFTKLKNNDHSLGLSINAIEPNGNIANKYLMDLIGKDCKAIKEILKKTDLDYLYNGILQHFDNTYYKQYWDDYCSGELNYIFLKNVALVSHTKQLLSNYYRIINQITFPIMGSL